MSDKSSEGSAGCEQEETLESPPAVEPKKPTRGVRAVREKIGEGRGNLERRSDWFKRRTSDPE